MRILKVGVPGFDFMGHRFSAITASYRQLSWWL